MTTTKIAVSLPAELADEMLAETGGPLNAKERKAADRALGR